MKWRKNSRTYTELDNLPGVLPVDDSLGETPRLVSNLHRRILLRNELSEPTYVLGSLFFRRVGLGIIVRSNLKYTNWSTRNILRTERYYVLTRNDVAKFWKNIRLLTLLGC